MTIIILLISIFNLVAFMNILSEWMGKCDCKWCRNNESWRLSDKYARKYLDCKYNKFSR